MKKFKENLAFKRKILSKIFKIKFYIIAKNLKIQKAQKCQKFFSTLLVLFY